MSRWPRHELSPRTHYLKQEISNLKPTSNFSIISLARALAATQIQKASGFKLPERDPSELNPLRSGRLLACCWSTLKSRDSGEARGESSPRTCAPRPKLNGATAGTGDGGEAYAGRAGSGCKWKYWGSPLYPPPHGSTFSPRELVTSTFSWPKSTRSHLENVPHRYVVEDAKLI